MRAPGFEAAQKDIIGAIPVWPYSTGWGYYPSGGVGLILIIVLILVLMGRI
jgi:Protein of unknown function (DUF3309)